MFSSSHATTELVQLREAKFLSIFDTHDGSILIVDTDFDNRSTAQYFNISTNKFVHDTIFFDLLHPTMKHAYGGRWEDVAKFLGSFCDTDVLEFFGLFDEW